MPDLTDPAEDDREVLAGELALGLLSGAERAAALRRVVAEPGFAAEVETWRLRLAPLLDDIPEAPAPPAAWPGIQRAIGPAVPPAASRWRAAALASGAIAATLALVLATRPTAELPPPARSAPLLAQVAGSRGAPILTARYDAVSGELRVRTDNLPVGDRAPELWVIVGDAPPRSLGLVALNGVSAHIPPEELRRMLIDGVTIVVTLEPRSGAPHAVPTGEILGTANLVAI